MRTRLTGARMSGPTLAGIAVTGVPITYSVDGKQYVTITSGPLKGTAGGLGSVSAQWGTDSRLHPKRLLTFVLDGTAKLPPTPPPQRAKPLAAPDFKVDPALARAGAADYIRCIVCHGPGVVAGGIAPDLRASPLVLSRDGFAALLHGDSLVEKGMPQYAELSDVQLDGLRHFIRSKAEEALH